MVNLSAYLKKEATYIIGVSGGPDSMALFNMCREQGYSIVVAHMNYQKRESAMRDEQLVIAECEKYGIPYAIRKQNKECTGNFQAFARAERYAFYQELITCYHGDGVLLAHHMDDHIETYLMQKERGSIPYYYGIAKDTNVLNCHVIRPLLEMTKQELLDYCLSCQIPFGIDESNLSDYYTRNRIRHEIIDYMSKTEKLKIADEIAQINITWEIEKQEIQTFLNTWQRDCKSLARQNESRRRKILFQWVLQEIGYACTHEESKILSHLVEQSNHWTRLLQGRYIIYNEYGHIAWDDEQDDVSFTYIVHEPDFLKLPWVTFAKQGMVIEGVNVSENDFPLTLRNVHPGDAIQLRLGRKRVHRWFVDRKIPRKERKKWPVLVNAVGNVIFVPGIGCDIAHFSNNPNVFVLK